MNNQTETIRKFVGYINNEAHLGGFWLPNIQRPFVWSEDQIERLYDSILREYPIGTLLMWKTNGEIKHRKFIDNWKDSIRLIDFYVPTDTKPKMLVLDGQQRMQSLFIGLKGSYNGKELFFNVLSGEKKSPEDIRFNFKFMDAQTATFPWVKFKSLVLTDQKPKEIKKSVLSSASRQITNNEDDRLDDNITLVRDVFCTQENILYQEVDSIDRSDSYSEDDIVEIFIRANSGGTFLNKSDLMFSLLISSWEEAEEKVTDLLDILNRTGYEFNRDFILKTCLVILGKGARYNVGKFRDKTTRDAILGRWDQISAAVKLVKDYIYGNTFLKTDKTIPSYLSLIPLIYYAYHFPKRWNQSLPDYQTYLIRTSLTGVYGGQPDNIIDKLIKNINEQQDFKLSEILGVIREDNRTLEISREALLGINYWKKEIHLLFNIWYGFNYQPALAGNQPQIDHIFPQSALKAFKVANPETGKMNLLKYKLWDRDQLGNLMLLTATENGAGGKTDILPEDWFADKSEDYLNLHLIPKDRELWKLDNFEAFIEARKQLILEKFNYLLFKQA